MKKLLLAILIVSIIACKPSVKKDLPYYNSPDFTPEFLSRADAERKITHRVADFSFTDQHQKPISAADVDGKVHVANFFFTSCGSICPKMTANMKKVQDAFAGDRRVMLLSYSVTPWLDNAARLETYAVKNGINSPDWHLLTGSRGEIYALARRSYFAEESLGFTKDSTEFLHSEHLLLVDGKRRLRGIYNGTLELEAEQLVKDIKTLLED